MGSKRDKIVVALCIVFVIFSHGAEGKVFNLPDYARLFCLKPGSPEGKVENQSMCNVAGNNEEKTVGIRSDGKCARCGNDEYFHEDDFTCPSTYSAVTYVKDNIRRCACNIGFYGDSTATGCKPCPTGTTTQGYGASGVKECNICAVGYTGRASKKCTACSKVYNTSIITTPAAGDNQACVCPLGYTGAPGKCKKCSGFEVTTAYPGAQTCICPAGGKPPFCKPCKDGVVMNGKCECPAGVTGVWPKCRVCPGSLSYEHTTLRPGRNQPCVCALDLTMEDFPWSVFLTRDSKTGACKCNNNLGYYLKVVPNNKHNGEWSLGPCDGVAFNGDDPKNYKVLTLNGTKRLGCDTTRGYAASIASQVFPEGGSGPYCFKCGATDNGSFIDTKTSRCECKKGYGVNPEFGRINEADSNVKPPFDKGYCIKCDGPMLKLGRIPETEGNDTFCRCNWERGWAGAPGDGSCKKCKAGYIVNTTTGACECPKGYYSFKAGDNEEYECVPEPKCGQGEYARDGMCYCDLIKDTDGMCIFPASFCNKINITFWKDVKADNADFNFSAVLGKEPFTFVQKTWSKVNSSSNLLDLIGVKSKKKVAVLVQGYICTRAATVTVVQMTSVGSAEMMLVRRELEWPEYVDTLEPVIQQITPHSSSKTSYYGVDSAPYSSERALQFRVQFYSGGSNGVLQLKAVGFPYKSWWFSG